ncbi:MAG: sigma-70 family RNA polymerase sigma factor [Pirellulales bacterium]
MSQLPDTHYSLLARLAEPADAAAWSEFLETYEGAVFRYCRSRGLQEPDARDVVQEVLLAVHRAIGAWRPSGRPGSFRAWLIKTTHHMCLRMLRTQARRDRSVGGTSVQWQMQELTAAESGIEEDETEWQRFAFCWAAGQIQREVQPDTWLAFWRTAVDGEPPTEVAQRLNMRVGSVYAARCRVLARILERIQELSRSER